MENTLRMMLLNTICKACHSGQCVKTALTELAISFPISQEEEMRNEVFEWVNIAIARPMLINGKVI